MVRIVFLTLDGGRVELNIPAQGSVMEAAREHEVLGIEGVCGGCMACGTCHVTVDPAWFAKLPEPSEMERDILEGVREQEPCMRLTCQIPVTDSIDGLVLRIPRYQT